MKEGRIVISIPLPDEATQADIEALSQYIARAALTGKPLLFGFPTPKVYGSISEVTLNDAPSC